MSTVLATALADRYPLQLVLGEGGMATVYQAEDLKHHRQVALKVLRSDVAEALGRSPGSSGRSARRDSPIRIFSRSTIRWRPRASSISSCP